MSTNETRLIFQLIIGCFVALFGGGVFTFSIFSPILKAEPFSFTEYEYGVIAGAASIASFMNIPAGIIFDYCGGARATLFAGMLFISGGWLAVYFTLFAPLVDDHDDNNNNESNKPSLFLVTLLFSICSITPTFLEMGGIMSNLYAFRYHQCFMIISLKSFIGLGGSVLGLIYVAWFSSNDVWERFVGGGHWCLFLAAFGGFASLIGIIFTTVPPQKMEDPLEGPLNKKWDVRVVGVNLLPPDSAVNKTGLQDGFVSPSFSSPAVGGKGGKDKKRKNFATAAVEAYPTPTNEPKSYQQEQRQENNEGEENEEDELLSADLRVGILKRFRLLMDRGYLLVFISIVVVTIINIIQLAVSQDLPKAVSVIMAIVSFCLPFLFVNLLFLIPKPTLEMIPFLQIPNVANDYYSSSSSSDFSPTSSSSPKGGTTSSTATPAAALGDENFSNTKFQLSKNLLSEEDKQKMNVSDVTPLLQQQQQTNQKSASSTTTSPSSSASKKNNKQKSSSTGNSSGSGEELLSSITGSNHKQNEMFSPTNNNNNSQAAPNLSLEGEDDDEEEDNDDHGLEGEGEEEGKVKSKQRFAPEPGEEDPEIDELRQKANKAFNEKNFDNALILYSQAISLFSEPFSAAVAPFYSNRSATFVALMQFEDAIRDATSCIRCRPNWFKPYYRRAVAQEALGNNLDAQRDYQAALSFAPGNQELLDGLERLSQTISSTSSASQVFYRDTNNNNNNNNNDHNFRHHHHQHQQHHHHHHIEKPKTQSQIRRENARKAQLTSQRPSSSGVAGEKEVVIGENLAKEGFQGKIAHLVETATNQTKTSRDLELLDLHDDFDDMLPPNRNTVWQNICEVPLDMFLIWIMFFFLWSTVTVIIQNVSSIFYSLQTESFGYSTARNSIFVSIFGLANAIGRVGGGVGIAVVQSRGQSVSMLLRYPPLLMAFGLLLFLVCSGPGIALPLLVTGVATGQTWSTAIVFIKRFFNKSGQHYAFCYTAAIAGIVVFVIGMFPAFYEIHAVSTNSNNNNNTGNATNLSTTTSTILSTTGATTTTVTSSLFFATTTSTSISRNGSSTNNSNKGEPRTKCLGRDCVDPSFAILFFGNIISYICAELLIKRCDRGNFDTLLSSNPIQEGEQQVGEITQKKKTTIPRRRQSNNNNNNNQHQYSDYEDEEDEDGEEEEDSGSVGGQNPITEEEKKAIEAFYNNAITSSSSSPTLFGLKYDAVKRSQSKSAESIPAFVISAPNMVF